MEKDKTELCAAYGQTKMARMFDICIVVLFVQVGAVARIP
jgi:hypothetical protein